MITTGIDKRVKVQQIIENQVPEFLISESPKAVDFLKQYYISQEYQGGPIDLTDNLDQYIKLDNLTPEVIVGETKLISGITTTSTTVNVSSTKGFPKEFGLFKIEDEVITYTGITTNSFTGCIRGFSGITTYHADNNPSELVFSDTIATNHENDATVVNLSALFLKEFYKKTKKSLTPGLENVNFVNNLDVSNFIKNSKSLYQSKGTEESFRILFNILYNETPKILDLEEYLIKPSTAEFIRREVILAEALSGNPIHLVGQTIIKSTDSATRASISEVEPLTRKGKVYYKIGLFVGFNDVDLIEGTFNVSPKTKVIGNVSVGSSVITVDSTVGFGATGTLVSGISTNIYYSDKSVNQFFGCQNIVGVITSTNDIRSKEFYYGYENGDLTKKVELRLTGVLSKFVPTSDIRLLTQGENITVRNVGEKILNPLQDKTKKEIFANSWIYNTSSRFTVKNISGANIILFTRDIDKSSLKVGDNIEVLFRNEEEVVATGTVGNIDKDTSTISINNLTLLSNITSLPDPNRDYDLRRVINRASSTKTDMDFGQNILTSDVTNVYNDMDEDFYVASNSLPSYQITTELPKSIIPEAVAGNELPNSGYNPNTLKYSIISFPNPVPFITGDEIFYTAQGTVLPNLPEGSYFVEVLSNTNQIRLYRSRSFIPIADFVEFEALQPGSGTHTFSLVGILEQEIASQKLFKKFPINPNLTNSTSVKTTSGSTGLLANGVEITNYKSEDKIYFGPLDRATLLNGGDNYDVINPPEITLSGPGAGNTTALIRPVISGSIQDVQVDPQKFGINRVITATIEGGNGDGAILEPVLFDRKREISFDARLMSDSGGVDNVNETITFQDSHNIIDGQPLVYDRNDNPPLGIGSFTGSDAGTSIVGVGTTTLVNTATYYPEVINPSTIKLYQTLGDLNAGINTVGFTTTNKIGVHKFKLYYDEKTLHDIQVIDGGSGYENRQVFVKPTGINTVTNTIHFDDHGFNNGDKIVYATAVGIGSTLPTTISGLSTATGITTTTNFYKVLKVNDDAFRLTNAGLGGTITTEFERKDYIKFSDQGTGFQVFKYPDIILNLKYELAHTGVGIITATPVVRGPINDVLIYEKGSGYGSDILNLEKSVDIKVKTGKDAELKPIVTDGKITFVEIQTKGREYSSAPDLEVVGIGTGLGAKLRAVVRGGRIEEVIILEGGLQYQQDKTEIKVVPPGSGAKIDVSVRPLTLNKFERYGSEALLETNNKLQYSMVGYSTQIGENTFGDDGSGHSPLIGWAYDGNPIYGPYGYSDSTDDNSPVKILTSGYILDPNSVVNRPNQFSNGFFVEDYRFTNAGDLDQHNGRYGRTPEFPNGTYAYFVGINSNSQLPVFPYFIGDTYRTNPSTENFNINQSTFNFNDSNLIRNSYPYKVSDAFADNDFIIESNEITQQSTIVESTTAGFIDSIQIINAGDNYKVGDSAIFDNTNTNGGGLSVSVRSISGKKIESINTTVDTYNATFVWRDPSTVSAYISTAPSLNAHDNVVISGLSTTAIKGLSGTHKIGIDTAQTVLYQEVPSSATTGIVTDIYVANIPENISIGSSIGIGTEKLLVLNTFNQNNVLRVQRGLSSGIHSVSTPVSLIPNFFNIPLQTKVFDSKLNDQVYFNPHESIGVGTAVGLGSTATSTLGDLVSVVSTPTHSIRLPNHPFKTNQRVTLTKPGKFKGQVGYALTVSKDDGVTTFNIPETGNSQDVYVIRKSKDYIGIVTQVGLTTTSDGLAFVGGTPAKVGNGSFEYLFESNFDQVTGTLQRIDAVVSVSTAHGLRNTDVINLSVNPNQSVGIGTSTQIDLRFDSDTHNLLVNPFTVASSGVTTASNNFNSTAHNLNTGDKVQYISTSVTEGLTSQESYYVFKVDDNNFKLGETYDDVNSNPANIIELTSTGGATGSKHEFSLINPPIPVLRDNNLVFGVGHPSLLGYELNIYHDKDYKNQFVSVGNTTNLQVIGVGTVGVTSTATVTLSYSDKNPTNLFYNIKKSGFISTSDTDVVNYNKIHYLSSNYSGQYSIFNVPPVVGASYTSFSIALPEVPEKLSYASTETNVLKYSTKSRRAKGPIDKISIDFGGLGYDSLPSFVSVASTQGTNATLLPDSTNINRVDDIRILNPGFEYSSDPTLKPEAFISPVITIINSDTISSIEVIEGGKNYTSPPNLKIINPITREEITSTTLNASILSNSLNSVNIVVPPKGLQSITHEIFAVNNDNGSTINRLVYTATGASAGLCTCTLVTPVLGFSTPPFAVNDEIFVEGLQKYGDTGTGFNSDDNGYKFFKVTGFSNTNPATVSFNLSNITSDPGIAKTVQNSYGSIIKKSDYPQFKVTQENSKFSVGEKLLAFVGTSYIPVDLKVSISTNEFIKIEEITPGAFTLVAGQLIKGFVSGNIATINTISKNSGRFDISYSLRQDQGWNNDIGKLSQDYQRVPDNDYYQNLSYSVKSSVTYDTLVSSVNRLLHTSGLKNFADVGITSITNAGITTSSFADTLALDFIDQKRVDTINNFDFALDIDTDAGKSKFLKLKNTKLSPYIECKTNRVLEIDDISRLFKSTATSLTQFLDLSISAKYATFLVQIRDPNTGNTQISDVVIFKDDLNMYTAERSKIHTTSSELGTLIGQMDTSKNVSLKFTPDDPENNDYDIKILQTSFNTNLTGIGTQSIGFVNLSGINTTVATATTSTIISTNINNTDAFFATVEVNDLNTDETNFVDLYLTHDGSSSYVAEFYSDTENGPVSNFIGTFISEIDSNILSLKFENDQPNEVLVRSRVIGIGTTASGIGTYRFKNSGQLDNTEKTARFESNFSNVSTASTIATFVANQVSTLKGIVRVSSGSTSALHQVLVAHDSTDANSVQYPFLSIGSTSGIGTFSSTLVGNDLCLNFHPDPLYTGGTNNVQVQVLTESLYTDIDLLNTPLNLQYGTVSESILIGQYDALNGLRSNKTSFVLQNNSTPIFQKQFNPSDTANLDASTGIFTIKDHFFETGERLIYTPNSTFEGIPLTGIATAGGTLGSEVYAIRLTKDTFKISKSRPDAVAGVAVTFTGTGSGNAHEFEMFKKNEKVLMSIDGVIQSPIAFTPITTDLEYNITDSQTTFSVTGISSIQSDQIIKINDEFMKITNVGLGTTSVGPITETGSVNILVVKRGVIGSAATNHSSGDTTRLFSGGYNIVDSSIHFTDPPTGDANATQKTQANLESVRSSFNGRVFLRKDYSANRIFDDISGGFTGIGATHLLKVGGGTTAGIQTGSSILLLNGIFQTPTTSNNLGNNYEFAESGGASSVIFTGITSSNGQKIISDTDVNQNQLPRGGVIVSLGSTGGLGVANLAPAKVKPTVGAGGSTIVGVCGIATTGESLGISTAKYNHLTGQLQVTTSKKHKFREINEFVRLDGLVFNPSLTIPSDRSFSITGITSEKTFTTDIGVNNQARAYVGSGTVFEYFPDLSFGSGYRNPVSVAVTDIAYEHKFVSAATGAVTGTGGPFTPTNAVYESHTGLLTLTIPNHGRSSGNVQIVENSLTFTCSRDYHKTNHTYPRSTDPAGGSANLPITVVDANTITVNVGPGGGAGTGAVITAEVVSNTHVFVSASTNAVSVTGGSPLTPTGATYDPATGNLVITKASHGLSTSDTVGLATNSFVFRCAQDNFETTHSYPRSGPTPSSAGGDPAHNSTLAITSTTTDTFTVNVGITNTGTGGALKFNISSVGQGYVTPSIQVSAPSYENLPIVGVSRRGIGSTTDTGTGVTVDIEVGAANTSVGIGSTSYEVVNFKLNNNGYNFKLGDVFKPVGLVTDRFLNTSQLINDFELTVTEVFNDQYSSWNFGQFDFIDSIKDLQNGVRKRFPIFYNASLLSFEIDPDNPDSSLIDLDALLLIFVNGVVQEPGKSYTFDGGSSFDFVQAPDANDIVDIFFYKGTNGIDSVQVSAGASLSPTIKTGDVVQLNKIGITTGQDPRTIFSILGSDEVETNIYTGLGINESVYKPFDWTKQKVDKKISGEVVSKVRDSIESQVYPTAKIIDDISTTSNELFLDNAKFFNYEEDFSALTNIVVGGLIVDSTNPVSAGFTATVSIGGTIQALNITNSGSGYVGSTTSISISAPSVIGVGVGVTATATATITNGVITNTTITNPGLGYTISAVPQVLAQLPRPIKEDIDTITTIQGFDGSITGIAVTGGIGHPTALEFKLSADLTNNPNSVITDLKVGYPVYIFGTQVGHGVTSVVSDDSTVVATGTTCVDSIYFVNAFNEGVGIITCNIMTGVNTSGIDTTGRDMGSFSWGRLTGFTRTNPISIGVTGLTIDSGLTTYPSIQRRDFGLRDNGSLRKDLG